MMLNDGSEGEAIPGAGRWQPSPRLASPRRLYYGWWIVAAWVVLNIYWAGTLNYGLTAFFTPVRQSFGWSAALLALIFSLGNVLNGLFSPLTGAWFDRAGSRPLMLVASLCSGVGLLALSRTSSLPALVAAFTLVSAGYGIWSGTGLATIGLWFSRRRGLRWASSWRARRSVVCWCRSGNG